jgi:tetratricopeptide (TPR) repeat protein
MKRIFFMLVLAGLAGTGTVMAQPQTGRQLFTYERYQSAVTAMQKAVSEVPTDADAWYWLIRSQLALNKAADAAGTLNRIPADLQNTPLMQVARGAVALYQGDSTTATTLFETAIGTKRKKDPLIQLAVAEVMIQAPHGNPLAAIALLEQAADRDKHNAAIYTAMGDAYRKLYNGSGAVRAYEQAIAEDKNNVQAYYKIGKIYQTQNNVEVFSEYFNKAIAIDSSFGPVYYPLYYYYYYRDVNKAREYLNQYIAHTDPDINNQYMLTDLYYVSQQYPAAIAEANKLIAQEGESVKPRIYKLLAYSYDGLKDYTHAETYLKTYFEKENDSNYVSKDFDLMARIAVGNNQQQQAATWYEKAYELEKDSTQKIEYVKKITAFYKGQKDYTHQAEWMGKLYDLHANLTNVDLFNWGVAWYNAAQYEKADSVFGIYASKYPDQSFGYYWRARSNAAIDTAMETGIAIPHYENLIAVASKDTANVNNKKWLIQAYGYIAAYKVNKEKEYDEALECYDRILELDPANNDAVRYKELLGKMIDSASKEDKKPH